MDLSKMMCPTFLFGLKQITCSPLQLQQQLQQVIRNDGYSYFFPYSVAYFEASSTATATATVIPTMGLLPAPMRPFISTYAKTVDEFNSELNTKKHRGTQRERL